MIMNPDLIVLDEKGNQLSVEEVVNIAAEDPSFYSHTFFPKTARQASPPFHVSIWDALENPAHRHVNVQVFRGGAKTTTLRLFTSRRVAYGISNTILYIGKSEGHAARSIRWLRRQIEFNRPWASTFGLSPGSKWTDIEAEIECSLLDHPIWIMGMGITGSVRGINSDDFRPDLIIVDDVVDEENSSSPLQRKQVEDLLYGAVKQSLAPASENPNATMAMLQTPLNREDISTKALADPDWTSFKFGCFDGNGESVWPERWTTEELLQEKAGYIFRNQTSIWLREKELKLTSPETSAFRSEWLQYFEVAPKNGTTVMVIDPVPPPSPAQLANNLHNKDYEAFAIVRRFDGKFYVLETSANRGHDPSWTVNEFFRLLLKYRPREVLVEAVGYQRALAWILAQEMKNRRQYAVIVPFTDSKNKYNRIVDPLSRAGSNNILFIRPEQNELREQFTTYPDVDHDDVLETVAIGVGYLNGKFDFDADDDEAKQLADEEKDIPTLKRWRGAP
jgi:predicted phage terminase large subunit-like protein